MIKPTKPHSPRLLALRRAAEAAKARDEELALSQKAQEFKALDEGGEDVPFFMFGGADEWFMSHFKTDINGMVGEMLVGSRVQELIDCLESCLIGDADSRREYEHALTLIESDENREAFRAQRHDQRRSSLNDIGGRAYAYAKKLRARMNSTGE